jgi:hypothetical protein
MKKVKSGIEISHWKVNGTDAFAAITPAWSDEELDIGLNKEDLYDDQDNTNAQAQEINNKTIHKKK